MRKWIVVCVSAVLLAAGIWAARFLLPVGLETGIRGDPVRFSASAEEVRALKGEPDRDGTYFDTPLYYWVYENQSAFGRNCSILYEMADGKGENPDRVIAVCAVFPTSDGEDGRALFDAILAEMSAPLRGKWGYYCRIDEAERDGVLRSANFGVTVGPPFLYASVEQCAEYVRVSAEYAG